MSKYIPQKRGCSYVSMPHQGETNCPVTSSCSYTTVWFDAWWRHQMGTFSALLAICTGSSPVIGEFPAQRPVTRSFGVFFDLHLTKRLSKQSWGWCFETPSRPLWRHCNGKGHHGCKTDFQPFRTSHQLFRQKICRSRCKDLKDYKFHFVCTVDCRFNVVQHSKIFPQ